MSRLRAVGLGLVLDEEQAIGGGSAQAVEHEGGTSPHAVEGSAAARARELIDILDWDSPAAYTGAADPPSGSSASRSSSRSSTPSSGRDPLPQLTISSSCSIPTSGNPVLSPLSSASPSSAASLFAATQRAYPLAPSSLATPYLTSSRSSSPTPSFSRPPSYVTSVAMDRTSTASKSRGEIHGRQQSLTSACAPVTSGFGPPSPGQGASSNGFFPPGASSSPVPVQRSWKVYDWGGSKESVSATPLSTTSSSHSDDPRKGHKSVWSPSGALSALSPAAILALPTTLLSYLLAPLSNAPPAPHHHSPVNASTAPTPKGNGASGKRWPFPLRLLTISYLIFSVLFFALRLSAWTFDGAIGRELGKAKITPRNAGDEDRFRGKVEGWAQKVAGNVQWRKALGYGGGEEASGPEMEAEGAWDVVKRIGQQSEVASFVPTSRRGVLTFHLLQLSQQRSPSRTLSRPSRTRTASPRCTIRSTGTCRTRWNRAFGRPATCSGFDEELTVSTSPRFIFRAETVPAVDDITACFYSNEAWLSTIPSFVHAWGGPVSLVFEAAHARASPLREGLLAAISDLRDSDPLVAKLVDFHLVGAPPSLSERSLNKTRERLVLHPIAHNFHTNLARFFASTDVVFMAGDARVTPSAGLRTRLTSDSVRTLVLEHGDAIVVPTFGFVRDVNGESDPPKVPSLAVLRDQLRLAPSGAWDGVGEDEFAALAAQNAFVLTETLPIARSEWPTKKANLVGLVNTRVGTADTPTSAQLALYDRGWDLNHGPTNWYLWRKSGTDPRLLEPPDMGGGVGLGLNGGVGGGREVFRVTDYDLHYSPYVVVSRKGQPWCTERFEHMQAACVYQMYLSGAEMWVLPDEWAFTLEGTEKPAESVKEDPAQKLKVSSFPRPSFGLLGGVPDAGVWQNSISSRLYGKFHQEACMHYGREFLSVQMWDSDKAQHLRSVCAKTLTTWGEPLPSLPSRFRMLTCPPPKGMGSAN